MKKIKFLNRLLFIFLFPLLIVSCEEIGEDNSPKGTGTDFATISSSYEEADGTGTVTIPLRNGSVSESEISFTGTAVEGEDFELIGVTDEGIQISIIDDDDFESLETVKVVIPTTGNNIHTINIYSDCEDIDGLAASHFAGAWHATEYYCGFGVTTGSCDYGPYAATLVQDATNPNRFDFGNFYDSGYDVYMIFDMAAGTVHFPNQNAVGDGSSPAITASTGTFSIDLCDDSTTLTISLNYDGSDWINYFTKD